MLPPLLLAELLYLFVAFRPWGNGWADPTLFIGLFAAQFAIVWQVSRLPGLRPRIFIGGALLFRLTLLPAGFENGEWQRFQLYDSDIWRYLWDGHVIASGINPYRDAPRDSALDALASDPYWINVRENINYGYIPTIYPPAAEAVFAVVHPLGVLGVKLAAVAFDLLALWFLILTLRILKRPMRDALWYAWNPLVIKVFAGSGHIDSLLVAGLAAMFYSIARGSKQGSSIAYLVAVLSKWSPLVLLPLLLSKNTRKTQQPPAGVTGANNESPGGCFALTSNTRKTQQPPAGVAGANDGSPGGCFALSNSTRKTQQPPAGVTGANDESPGGCFALSNNTRKAQQPPAGVAGANDESPGGRFALSNNTRKTQQPSAGVTGANDGSPGGCFALSNSTRKTQQPPAGVTGANDESPGGWFAFWSVRRIHVAWLLLLLPVAAIPNVFAGASTFAEFWQFNGLPYEVLREVFQRPLFAKLAAAAIVFATALIGSAKKEGDLESFARRTGYTLGALVVLSPAVMPWYVTWLLPSAILGRDHRWIAFSGLVFLAFFVMVDGQERWWVTATEYGVLLYILSWKKVMRREDFSIVPRDSGGGGAGPR